jgi:hypothetical protein
MNKEKNNPINQIKKGNVSANPVFNDCAIVVFSYDGYEDLWDPFFKLWFKYWPDCPYPIYLQTNHKSYPDERVTSIQVGDDENWSDSARTFLSQVDASYVLAVMEDYFLLEMIDTNRIQKLVEYTKKNSLGCLRLFASPQADYEIELSLEGENIGEIAIGAPYRVSLQAGIWCKKTLHDLIIPGETAWDLEITGSRRADHCEKPFYSLFGPAKITSPLPYYCTAVEKGEWIKEAVQLCEKEGISIDLSKRPIEPVTQTFLRKIKRTEFIPHYRKLRQLGPMTAPAFIGKAVIRKILSVLNNLKTNYYIKTRRQIAISSSELKKLKQVFVQELQSNDDKQVIVNEAWSNFSSQMVRNSKTKNISDFLNWDIISSTMFIDNTDYTQDELQEIKSRKNWKRYKKALREDNFGSPPPNEFYPLSSGNLIHHAYQVASYEEMAGLKISEFDAIIEFGGGYGSMCRLCQRLEFQGNYFIFDLPPFSALQRLFLSACGFFPQKTMSDQQEPILICSSDLSMAEAWLNQQISQKKKILFIGTWSLSEAPIEVRAPFIDKANDFAGLLIAYQSEFGKVDNVKYFSEFQKKLLEQNENDWRFSEQLLPKMPIEIGRYLFAIRDKGGL